MSMYGTVYFTVFSLWKWFCSSRTILEKYLKHAVNLAEDCMTKDKESMAKRSQMRFHLAHYADALFRSYEDRLNSSEWQAAMRLRKHKVC